MTINISTSPAAMADQQNKNNTNNTNKNNNFLKRATTPTASSAAKNNNNIATIGTLGKLTPAKSRAIIQADLERSKKKEKEKI